MSYQDVITKIENLILGNEGVNNTMSQGRFALLAEEYSNENIPNITAERKVKVSISGRKPHFPINSVYGHGHYIHKLDIVIFYALTGLGQDMPEGLTPNHGSADIQSIEIRRLDDIAAIEDVLLHDINNWAGTDPEIYNLQPNGEPSDLEIDEANKIAKQRLSYSLYLKTTIPSNQ